ncbi:hypothetical protein G5V65_21030 [Rhodobacter sp. HX-7-19]|uniref:Uncharacterized protein n=1 Tax=Paragemmobacter kunshanensis TaxID=2583234 RepID=A0A6M1U690_9RHOB|nr:hypothetical protein [Rhodobacter kunshanensis]NGQ93374.1 hypothetical protein [Rhodobacter kunshanensis]
MTWLFANWRLVLLGLVVAVLAYMRIEVGWLRSRLDRAQARAKELQDYRTTRERIDDAPVPSDADAARRWLHDRKP